MQIATVSTKYTYTEKNGLVGLNSNSGRKWTNQNFLIKFIRILIEITRILINIIILIKIRILVDFIRNCINQNFEILCQLEF